jgi:hypothetical protein
LNTAVVEERYKPDQKQPAEGSAHQDADQIEELCDADQQFPLTHQTPLSIHKNRILPSDNLQDLSFSQQFRVTTRPDFRGTVPKMHLKFCVPKLVFNVP